MEERLVQLLKSEGINPTRFAERIGVQRSSMSHILSGRNKPSYDFIVKILENFPMVNPDWLLRGKGNMYKESAVIQPGLFDYSGLPTKLEIPEERKGLSNQLIETGTASNTDKLIQGGGFSTNHKVDKAIIKEKKIEKIVIFYSDNTFTEYLRNI